MRILACLLTLSLCPPQPLAAWGHQGDAQKQTEVGEQGGHDAEHHLLARESRAHLEQQDVHRAEKQEMGAGRHGFDRIDGEADEQRGHEAAAQL